MRWLAVLAIAGCEGKQLGFGSPIAEGAFFPTDCSTTTDCALVPANGPCECGCDLRAISADADEDFWAWYLAEDCTPPACEPCAQPAVRAVCEAGQCATAAGAGGGGFGGFPTPPGGTGGGYYPTRGGTGAY